MNRPSSKYISFRYVEANIRRSSEYRKYNTDLPKWLHNKPKYFTKHCIEKINLAKDIKQEIVNYVENIEGQYFLVKTLSIGKCYNVNLGNENIFPRCECDAWKRSLLPCKYMVSVFEYFPEFGWESLPVNDVDTLHALEDQVKVSLELLENEAPKEDGVIVQPVKVKRKVKESSIKVEIPKAKRVKSNLTGRVGVKAEQMKLSSNLTLPNLIEEPVNQILENRLTKCIMFLIDYFREKYSKM